MTISPAFHLQNQASLLKYSAAPNETVVATIDDVRGVAPVSWAVVGTDGTATPSDYTLVLSGQFNSVCSVVAKGTGTAFLLRCTVAGGVDPSTGQVSGRMSATAKIFVPTSAGLEVGASGERYEGDPTFGTVPLLNNAIRAWSTGFISAIEVPSSSTFTYSQAAAALGAGPNQATFSFQSANPGDSDVNGAGVTFEMGSGTDGASGGSFIVDLKEVGSDNDSSGVFVLRAGLESPFLGVYRSSTATNLQSDLFRFFGIASFQDRVEASHGVAYTPFLGTIVSGHLGVNLSLSANYRVPTLTANITIDNPTGGVEGLVVRMILKQDATGGRTVTFGSAYKMGSYAVSATANTTTLLRFYYDGASMICEGATSYV